MHLFFTIHTHTRFERTIGKEKRRFNERRLIIVVNTSCQERRIGAPILGETVVCVVCKEAKQN